MAQPFIGEIRTVGFDFAPVGWSICDGALVQIADYEALFALIGTTYGGDGQRTFALPDLQGRIPVHQGNGGQGIFDIGQESGVEAVTLTVNQIPVHNHILSAQSANGTVPSPSNAFWAASPLEQFSSASPTLQMGANSLATTGGSQSHQNMPPFVCINFIIALEGLFPTRG